MTSIQITLRPNALSGSSEARTGWRDAISRTVNGWGIVTAEKHRVAAIKGNDLAFFAPAGADFDNPAPISQPEASLALEAAVEWARTQSGPIR